MEPESISATLQQASDVLALYTDSAGHTRSVYVTRQTDSGRLLLLEGLSFTLYFATESGSQPLDAQKLGEWMQESFASRHYGKKGRGERAMQRQAQSKTLCTLYPELERRWLSCGPVSEAGDRARRAYFDALPPAVTPTACDEPPVDRDALYQGLREAFLRAQVLDQETQACETQAALRSHYLSLVQPRHWQNREPLSGAQARAAMEKDGDGHFFVVQRIEELIPTRQWPCFTKLTGRQVWRAELVNHHALEHFVGHLNRFPIELDGQWYPQRIEGRLVQAQVLEPVADGTEGTHAPSLQIPRAPPRPHQYTLQQTQQFKKTGTTLQLRFPADAARTVRSGLLLPALFLSTAVYFSELGDDPFARLSSLAQNNGEQTMRSNKLALLLPWLFGHRCDHALLLPWSQRQEIKRARQTLALSAQLEVLQRQPIEKKAVQPGRKRVDLKRKPGDGPDDETGGRGGDGGNKKLRQQSMFTFMSTK